jgi:L-seryl-tRNA(Ser) seleniumtransferase
MTQRAADSTIDDPRRHLIAVYSVIEQAEVQELIRELSHPVVVEVIQEVLSGYRDELRPGDAVPTMEEVVARVRAAVLERESERLRPAVNATGIILHTGLGRAVLPRRAVEALGRMDRCCNMQVDIQTGKRASRNLTTERLLARLSGAEAALVVNNNAAATLLILEALCKGKEVIVSQGQVIEIGGSFRLPDCIAQSGARMVRVGTTNRTHLHDYERALSVDTGAILRVNPSNYRVLGFTKEVSLAELVSLKEKQDVLVIDDLGCGALVDTEQFGLPKECTVQESVSAGADIVCFSGDKLIGAAQAGIVVGKRELIAKIKKHPLTRMMRVCKLTDVVLEHSLRLFLEPETLVEEHPTLRMLAIPAEQLEAQARELLGELEALDLPLELLVKEDESAVGGGSMPVTPLRTFALAVRSPRHSLERLLQLLRKNEPPIVARISGGHVLIDMRTLLEGDHALVRQALVRIAAEQG